MPHTLWMMLGALLGGAWNAASLWCLVQMLAAWLGPQPSRRRVVWWLLVKFPALYLLAGVLLASGTVSLLGFCMGFTLVLIAGIAWFALRASRMSLVRSDGR
ncbi:MAG: hypothetical protein HY737_03625 [Candidatus Omnitrophica bacterium]|nr:hypothetical protein [Candidatus Omnitrophota bacterium]